MFNDLVGVTVRDMDFGPGQWQLTGNEVLITRGIEAGGGDEQTILTIDCPLRLEGSATNITFSLRHGEEDDPNRAYFRGPIDLNGNNLIAEAGALGYANRWLAFISFSGVISGV